MATLLAFSQSTLTPTEGETVTLNLTGAQSSSTLGSPPVVSRRELPLDPERYQDRDHHNYNWAFYQRSEMDPDDPSDGIRLTDSDNGIVSSYSGHRQGHVSWWWRNLNTDSIGLTVGGVYDAPPNFQVWDPDNPGDILGAQAEIRLEVVDPIIEPDYTHSAIVSIENNGFWEAGKSYDVVVNEAEAYSGWFAGYRSFRNTGLIGTGGTSAAGVFFNSKKGLINPTGIDTLFDSERVYGSTFYQAFEDIVNAAVTDGIIDSVTVISETQIENTTGDQDTDLWYSKRTYQRTYRFAVSSTAPAGFNYLVFTSFKDDTVEDFSSGDLTQTYDPVLEVSAFTVRVGIAPPPVPPRPLDYDEDAVWDPIAGAWTSNLADLTTLGGGRYRKQIVAIGHRRIYFGGF